VVGDWKSGKSIACLWHTSSELTAVADSDGAVLEHWQHASASMPHPEAPFVCSRLCMKTDSLPAKGPRGQWLASPLRKGALLGTEKPVRKRAAAFPVQLAPFTGQVCACMQGRRAASSDITCSKDICHCNFICTARVSEDAGAPQFVRPPPHLASGILQQDSLLVRIYDSVYLCGADEHLLHLPSTHIFIS